ncbi:MAG: GIY-YIG nuclease family protein [Candidatus Sungbacteria bacterium]|nr:GIY-YIG nuclease family protein [Candidatus Sungbacteria bacterium]
MWFLYLILCKDKSIYTGITTNLKLRFEKHRAGKGGRYTRAHMPVKLLYSEKFKTRSEALKREAQIKRLKRKQKLSLIQAAQS